MDDPLLLGPWLRHWKESLKYLELIKRITAGSLSQRRSFFFLSLSVSFFSSLDFFLSTSTPVYCPEDVDQLTNISITNHYTKSWRCIENSPRVTSEAARLQLPWMDGRTDRWIDGWMDGWTDDWWKRCVCLLSCGPSFMLNITSIRQIDRQ